MIQIMAYIVNLMQLLLYYHQFQNTSNLVTYLVSSVGLSQVLIHPSKMSYLCVKVVHHKRTSIFIALNWLAKKV